MQYKTRITHITNVKKFNKLLKQNDCFQSCENMQIGICLTLK